MTSVWTPATPEEAADAVQSCLASSTPIRLKGGGTRSAFREAADGASSLATRSLTTRGLTTRGMSGILAYNPAEMTMSALAGTPLAEIETALAANRQMLAFEPMDHRPVLATDGQPTIGGVFAANISGPRRFVAGAARDHLLGLRFVNGRGETISAGGRVMKNVTGLDLVKFLCGSRGTLGLITEVTFKVLPLPPLCATVVVSGLDDAEATAVMARAMALSVEVSGAAHLPESVRGRFLAGGLPDGPATVLRLEGLAASVTVRLANLVSAVSAYGPVTQLGPDETRALWREIRDVKPYADGTEKPLWRVSVAPGNGQKLVAALRLEAGVDALYDWQGGLVWMRMEADAEGGLVRRFIKGLGGGHATLVRGSAAVQAVTPLFEPEPPAVAALSARLKSKFDPQGIFGPPLSGAAV